MREKLIIYNWSQKFFFLLVDYFSLIVDQKNQMLEKLDWKYDDENVELISEHECPTNETAVR
jgi:hypothetical protein